MSEIIEYLRKSLETKDTITLIVSSVTLIAVIFQFFIKRKDRKSNYILDKKYELFSSFIKNYDLMGTLEKALNEMNQKQQQNIIVSDPTKKAEKLEEVKYCEDEGYTRDINLWLNLLAQLNSVIIDSSQFYLLCSPSLCDDLVQLIIYWDMFKKYIAMNKNDYDNLLNFQQYNVNVIGKLENTDFIRNYDSLRWKIINGMRRELDIKPKHKGVLYQISPKI